MCRVPAKIVCLIVGLLLVVSVAVPVMAESGAELPQETAPNPEAQAAAPILRATPQPALGGSQDLALVATVVPTAIRPISVRFEGVITRISTERPGEWQIDDIVFRVLTDTEIIFPVVGYPPRGGDYAVVSATRDGETLTAKRIVIREKWHFEFRGIITACPPEEPWDGEWLIGGMAVVVSSRVTVITNIPVRNYFANVEGRLLPDGKVEALRIEVLDPQGVANSFEFEGEIEVIPATPTGEGIWVIAGVQGLVDANTEFPADAEPVVGATAGVEGKRLADGTLYFERIRVLTDAERQVRVTGRIEEMQEEFWRIGEQTVEIEDNTFIDESRCRAAVGMWAEAIARRQGNQLIALRIRVERPD